MAVAVASEQRPAREQTRARYPDSEGFVERDGVRTFFELYGHGNPTILLLPTWSVIHSRCWKAQIAYLARHFRVLTFDPRGNGKSDRPAALEAYAEDEFAADALAVMDATATERAVLISLSRGVERSMLIAANHPERVAGMVVIAPALPLAPAAPRGGAERMFVEEHDSYEGWGKWNANHWLRDYPDFLDFFFAQVFSEPHSTKQIEDAVAWGLETDGRTMVASQLAPRLADEAAVRDLVSRIDCRMLVIHGRDDAVRPHASGEAFANIAGAGFVTVAAGHNPQARKPVITNLLIREFVDSLSEAR
jgi:pimeloyl-ACP methyl ester carboxylesterase